MYIVLGALLFGILIVIHELGHFMAAKRLGVKVNEFAIGMGPKIFSRQRGETLYAVRLLPFGGACMMEGEDEENPDPRAFTAQKAWKRIVILAAGAFMNLLFGFIIVLILQMGNMNLVSTTIGAFMPGFPHEGEHGLMVGDSIYSVDGERTRYVEDFGLFMDLPSAADGQVDLTIVRDGKKIKYENFDLSLREYEIDGVKTTKIGLYFRGIEPTVGARFNHAISTAANYVRLVKIGLVQLFSGGAKLSDLSGPVGLVAVINESANDPQLPSVGDRIMRVLGLGALIAVNLGVMNLLPIPALDGGRIVGVLITSVVEKVTRHRVNPKYEGYIHAGGIVLLMLLMVAVMISDIVKLL